MIMLDKRKKVIIGVIILVAAIGGYIGYYSYSKNSNEKIAEFTDYIQTRKESSNEYILGEFESTYNDLMTESAQAIIDKNKDEFEELKSEIKDLDEKVIKDNTESCNKKLEEIKATDMAALDDAKKSEVQEKFNEVSELIKSMRFSSANDSLDSLKENINNDLAAAEEAAKEAVNQNIIVKLDQIAALINNNDFDGAQKIVDELGNVNLSEDQKARLNGYISTIAKSKKRKLTVDEARELIKKEDGENVTPVLNKRAELDCYRDLSPEKLGVVGIEEETYFFSLDDLEGGAYATYLVGTQSGNVYKGPSNGETYFNLLKDGKIIKRYTSPAFDESEYYKAHPPIN